MRKSERRGLAVICLLLGFGSGTPLTGGQQPRDAADAIDRKVSADAVFRPPLEFLNHVKEKCNDPAAGKLQACFSKQMKQDGALPPAVNFSEQLGEPGFATYFRQAGPVSVVFVTYPYRANENEAWLLENVESSAVDVDSQKLLDSDALHRNPMYARLASSGAELTLWPGDRSGTYLPDVEATGGHTIVTVAYRLRRGCHACEIAGTAWYGFEFDPSGKYLRTRLMGVTERTASARAICDPEKIVSVVAGREIVVAMPPSVKSSAWTLKAQDPGGTLRLIESRSAELTEGCAAGPTAQEWRFGALKSGTSKIVFEQQSPTGPTAANITFNVKVTAGSITRFRANRP